MRKFALLIALLIVLAAGLLYFIDLGKEEPVPPPAGPPEKAAAPPAAPRPETAAREPSGHGPEFYKFPERANPPSYPAPKNDARITRTDDGKVWINTAVDLARKLNDPAMEVFDDLEYLDAILGQYRWVFQQNPVGDNADIVAQLSGANPRNIVVLPPDHGSINGAGELLDRYGNPYFFHAVSESSMDIWSLGKDGQLGTIDDVKLREDLYGVEPGESGN